MADAAGHSGERLGIHPRPALPAEPRNDGPAGLVISTDRHRLSADGRAVTVEDKGFGNVLNGLQFNGMAHAMLGDQVVSFPLSGAHDPVQEFRECKPVPGA